MAYIVQKKRKRGTTFYVVQKNPDGTGNKIWHPCDDERDANIRLFDVKAAEKEGRVYVRPDTESPATYAKGNQSNSALVMNDAGDKGITIAELMDLYIEQMSATKWIAETRRNYIHINRDYIVPFIGSELVSRVTSKYLQDYYNDLPNHKAAQGNNTLKRKKISPRTIHEVQKILRPALDMASAILGIIPSNPILSVKLPKLPKFKREQWSEDEVKQAFALCADTELWLFMALMFLCMRSEELSAITWDAVHISKDEIASDTAKISINKSLSAQKKADMEKTKYRDILYVFPNIKNTVEYTTVLKENKTEKSRRDIYLPREVAERLVEFRELQKKQISEWGKTFKRYGYDFVFVHSNGRPKSVDTLSERFSEFVEQNNLRKVDAYSLRHSGATAKLRETHNIKAVQGDMGHSTANMLMEVYATIVDEDRKENAIAVGKAFFGKS